MTRSTHRRLVARVRAALLRCAPVFAVALALLAVCNFGPPTRAWAGPSASATAGPYSAAALYNLGNSYARAGQPGMAVLNYERASLLAPDDPDIAANLAYVRQTAHLPPDPHGPWYRAFAWLRPTLAAWLGVAGVLIIGISLIAGWRGPRRLLLRRAAAGLGIVLVGLAVGNAWALWPLLHEAVIITAAAPVRVSPVLMGDQLFTLPEAEVVRMRAEHEDFVLVQTRAGRSGWVARADLAPVVAKR